MGKEFPRGLTGLDFDVMVLLYIRLLVSLAIGSIEKKDAIVGEVFGWGVGLNMEE